jgi:CHASE2 domain-containing sensor protein
MFGFINIAVDGDDIGAAGPVPHRAAVHPSWAARGRLAVALPAPPIASEDEPATAAQLLDRFPARHRPLRAPADRRRASVAASRPELFRDRLVLIGGDLQTPFEDRQRVPRAAGRSDTLPGLLVQALQVDTLARGRSIRAPSARPFALGAALLAFAAAAAVLCTRRLAVCLAAITALAVLAIAIYLTFQQRGILLPGTP